MTVMRKEKSVVMRVGSAAIACALLSGCGGWWGGDDDKDKLPGTRVSVLSSENSGLAADPSLAGVSFTLPSPVSTDWPNAGGNAGHYLGHVALGSTVKNVWSVGVGSGASGQRRPLAQPIVSDGMVFTVDAGHNVTAVDAQNGREVWSVELEPEYRSNNSSAGGLAYDSGHLYVGTGFADVIRLDAKTGKETWRQRVSGPIRSAPVVAGGQVYAVSIDNRIHALAATDGEILWSMAGLSEAASLLGGAVPAVSGDLVLAPFSSGEIYGIQASSGTPVWMETLGTPMLTVALNVMNNIAGYPVIDRDRVYVAGYGNMILAINLVSGERIWQQTIGATQNPWVAGDTIFITSSDAQLIALEASTGKIRWVTPLRQWKYEEDKMGRVVWTSPVLAGGRLYLANSQGDLLIVSPEKGEILQSQSLSDAISISPVVANGTLYLLTDDARLLAFR